MALQANHTFILALMLSLLVHGAVVFYQRAEEPAQTARVLQAQLMTQPLQSPDKKNQTEQQEQKATSINTEDSTPPPQDIPQPAPQPEQAAAEPETPEQQQVLPLQPPTEVVTATDSEKKIRSPEQVTPIEQPQPTSKESENQSAVKKTEEKHKAQTRQISDPVERDYVQRLLEHLNRRLIAPAEMSGKVRLRLTIQYRQIATQVEIIGSSGNPATDDWVKKAVLAANPFPPTPNALSQPFIFSPTLDLDSYQEH